MSYARVGAWVAAGMSVTLDVGATGCSSAEPPATSPTGVASMQGAAPVEQDQGWAALVEADREIRTLEVLRDRTADVLVRDAIDHQIAAIRRWSDALTDTMTIGDGQVHDAQIRRLSANLQRAMSAGVAAEMQADGQGPPTR